MQAWAAGMSAFANAASSMNTGATGTALALTNQANATNQANQAAMNFAPTINVLVTGFNTLNNTVNNAASSVRSFGAAAEESSGRSGVFLTTLKAMTSAFIGYKSLELARSVVEDADAWTLLNTRMITATGSQNNATVAMQQSYDIAQKTGQSVESVAKVYTRLAPAMAQLGHSSDDTRKVVDGLATALKLGGATTAEASAAMLQFAHAMSANQLNAREFNSLTREAPLLMKALENQMTNGNVHALKLLSGQGKVTANEILLAVTNAQGGWDKALSEMPLTFGVAWERVKNTWMKSIGEMNQDTQFNSAFAGMVQGLQSIIPAVVQNIGNAFKAVLTWIDKNKDALAEAWTQVKGLASDVVGIAKTLAGWAGALDSSIGSVNILGAAIFSVRLAIAIIQDSLTNVAGVVALIGAKVYEALINPFAQLASIIGSKLLGFVSALYDQMAKAASLLGKADMANTLKVAADNANEMSLGFQKLGMNSTVVGEALEQTAKEYFDKVSSSEGAVNKLLNGEKAITEEKKKQLTYQENFNKHPDKTVDPKVQNAINAEINKNQQAIAALNTEYQKLLEEQDRLMNGPAALKVGPAQTEYIKLMNELVAVENSHNDKNKAQIENDIKGQIVLAERNATLEIGIELLQQQAKAAENQLAKEQTLTNQIQAQVKALQERNAAFKNPNGKADFTDLSIADLEKQINTVQAGLSISIPGATGSEIANEQALLKTLQERVAALKQLRQEQAIMGQNKLTEEWDKMFDPAKSQKFTDSMVQGFGQMGKAIKDVVNTFRTFEEGIDKVQKAQQIASETTDPMLQAQRYAQAAQLEQQVQIDAFANMAQAASQFFDKHSRGYQVMMAVEKGFRIWQMATQLQSYMQQMTHITTTTTATVTADQVKTASAVTAAATQNAANATTAATGAVTGTINQAQGDPYTAFARMAAMAAIMAALGFAVGGGLGGSGSSNIAATRQATQGTGTVSADATKQSQSIQNSIDLLAKNSNIGLKYSSQMAADLSSIKDALTQVVVYVATNGTITGSDAHNTSSGFTFNGKTAAGDLVKDLLSGNTLDILAKGVGYGVKKNLVDSGITFGNQTVGSALANGVDAQAYQQYQVSKSLFGINYSNKNENSTSALDPQVTAQFNEVIQQMVNTVVTAGKGLGLSATDIQSKIQDLQIAIGNISLKGLSSDDIQKQLEAVFSAFGDKLVQAGLGDSISKFQQAGEGLLQTAVRVASGVEQAKSELSKFGMTAIDFAKVVNTAGDVGAEIVRQTIELKEAGTGIGDILQTLSGTAQDIGDTYASLLKARASLQDLGIAKDVTADLISAAGGLDTLQTSLDNFRKDFYTTAEQNAMDTSDLAAQFQALGLQMPNTAAGFRQLVETLAASGTQGQALATQVMGLSDAFNNLVTTYNSNVTTATTNLQDAYNTQSKAITDLQTTFQNFADSLKTFQDSLVTGDLSTGNAVDKYNAAKSAYEQTQAEAMQGNQTAIGNFQSVAQAFLTASRDVNASGSGYTSDYQEVLAQTQALQQFTTGQVSAQQQQLDALNKQVDGLITVNASVLSVADAIKALQAITAAGLGVSGSTSSTPGKATIMPVINGSHAMGLSMVPFNGYVAQLHQGESILTAAQTRSYQNRTASNDEAMVNEIRALRAEVSALRAGQNDQTAKLIMATYDSNEKNAEAINEGTKKASSEAGYSHRTQVKLA
jgi:tape measure domain-containing protein